MARMPIQNQPPAGVELSTLPTIRGRDAAHEWIVETLKVPVRRNMIVSAANNRKIGRKLGPHMGGALYFSTQELFDWIMSLTPTSTGA